MTRSKGRGDRDLNLQQAVGLHFPAWVNCGSAPSPLVSDHTVLSLTAAILCMVAKAALSLFTAEVDRGFDLSSALPL